MAMRFRCVQGMDFRHVVMITATQIKKAGGRTRWPGSEITIRKLMAVLVSWFRIAGEFGMGEVLRTISLLVVFGLIIKMRKVCSPQEARGCFQM